MADPDAIVKWMKEIVDQSGCEGIVLGLSGGIDSAVVAGLAKQACGENVLGVIMPCNSVPEDADYALQVAREFDIETEYIDLCPVFDSFMEILPEGEEPAAGNIKPRLRMTALYYFANIRNYLVAGTGNKSEIAIGYFTKYGDGGTDMLPLGGLLKCEVQDLARETGVPEEIITKTPSAGLWEGQTDEDEMGFTYSELDRVIAKVEKGGFTPQTKTEIMIAEMMKKSEHKRQPVPMYIPE